MQKEFQSIKRPTLGITTTNYPSNQEVSNYANNFLSFSHPQLPNHPDTSVLPFNEHADYQMYIRNSGVEV